LWGKWKNSGDGGQGTPWLYPKHFQGLSGWKVREIAAGNASLFALASTEEDVSTISWGQNAHHGELGHGASKPRSATNAVKVDDLEDFKVLTVSCGLGFTLLIVDSGSNSNSDEPKLGQLPMAFEKPENDENTKKRPAAAESKPAATKKTRGE
jgi:alpha-tubulin suppressor-like RCC1 family protein